MANKYAGEATIRLDRVRTIKLGFNALADFEKEVGQTLMSLIAGKTQSEAQNVLGFNHMRVLLWAALRHEDKNLTVERAGELVESCDGADIGEKLGHVMSRLMEVFDASFGGSKKKQGEATAAEQM